MINGLIEELLRTEKTALDCCFNSLDTAQFAAMVEKIQTCQGLILFTGIGKSGLIAEKIAATLTSTGSRSYFLSPINALHGDLGIASEQDLIVLISKSGESDELLHLIPALRNKGIFLIAWTSNPNSRLAKSVDFHFPIPFEKELCPFDMAPTLSTTFQLIVGDVLAIALMRLKGFSLDDFARNHPAGRIGRRITFKVHDLMVKEGHVPLCKPDDTLVNILVELSNKRCGCILVVDEKCRLEGIFTDGDLRRALQDFGPEALHKKLHELMIRTPRSIDPDSPAIRALEVMEGDQKHPITVLPVIDSEGIVKGLIKMHDIVQTGL